jgi:hypothetical protein
MLSYTEAHTFKFMDVFLHSLSSCYGFVVIVYFNVEPGIMTL